MIRILSFLILIASTSYIRAEETFPSGNFSILSQEGRSTITQIIAPDTLGLKDGRIVSVIGLEFPDLYNMDGAGALSQTAKRVLSDMLLGQDIRLYQSKNKKAGRINRMGHHMAHVTRANDNAWIQGTLLSLGLARVRTLPANSEMANQMLALESEARREKRGLWAIDNYRVLNADTIPNKSLNNYATVQGTVQSIATVKDRTYLNFGKDWKTDFTVVITNGDKRLFSKQGIDILSWNKKRLRVRGWLETYNGPMIDVTHPAQIEVLE